MIKTFLISKHDIPLTHILAYMCSSKWHGSVFDFRLLGLCFACNLYFVVCYITSLSCQGYVPLYQSWESFYTRNVYRRIRDVWNIPIASCAGSQIDILERVTHDHGWSFEYVPLEGLLLPWSMPWNDVSEKEGNWFLKNALL